MQGQQRGVVLDAAELRHVERLLGHDEGHVGHHAEIGLQRRHLLPYLGLLERLRLEERQIVGEGSLLDGIHPLALVRLAVDADDILSARDQGIEHGLAECLLAIDDDSHDSSSRSPGVNRLASDSGRGAVLRVVMSITTLVTLASHTQSPVWSNISWHST